MDVRFARNTLTPLATVPGSSQAPLWTPDGTRVIYRGTRKGFRNLYWRPVDGSGDEEPLTTKPDVVADADVRVIATAAGSCSTRTAAGHRRIASG